MRTHFWLILIFLLLLFLYFIPRSILYADAKIIGWFIFALIFGLLPYLVYKTIDSFNTTTQWRVGLAALSVLIVGPTFGLYHNYKETEELKLKGVWTKANVIEKKYISSKSHSGWVIQCSFNVDGKDYQTIFKDDVKNEFNYGDTLDLIYSKDFPKINEIGYLWTEK